MTSFYHAVCYANEVYAVTVCLCVGVLSHASIKATKPKITQLTPYDSQGTLLSEIKIGTMRTPNAGGVGKSS